MKKIKVSVIVPVYNTEEYKLKRCLDSILNQTLQNVEIIIINDGSKKNTIKTLNEYKNRKGITLYNQINSGPSKSRNKGLELAKGDYISFVDSDDFIDTTMLEKLYNSCVSNKSDLAICGRYNYYSKIKEKAFLPNVELHGHNIFTNNNIINDTTPFIWDKLFVRDTIKKNNISFSEEIHYAEDCIFLTEYKCYAKNISIIQEPLYYYDCRNENSITNTCDEKILHITKAMQKIVDFLDQKEVYGTFQENILKLSLGFYKRRVKSFAKNRNIKIQLRFISNFEKFFVNNFTLEQLKTNKISIAYKPKREKIKIMYRIYLYSKIKRISKIYKKTKNSLNDNKTRYIRYRKITKIKENQVLFFCYAGTNITDSPFYMIQHLNTEYKMKIFVCSRNLKKDKKYLRENKIKARLVLMNSKKYVKLLASSKYIITNSGIPQYVIKREKQIFVNLWHGTPLKTLGVAMNNGISDLANSQNQFLMCDYLLYPNEYTKENMMKSFFLNNLYTNKVILSGYPRNSIFFDNSYIKELKEKMNISDKKVYIYMPTWRGSSTKDKNISNYKKELIEILNYLDQNLNNDIIIFVKLHQFVMKHISLDEYEKIKIFPENYETYKFLNIADCLITDYSSVFFDYINTRKEVILFMYDYNKYMKDRGTYLDVKSLPFTKLYTVERLVQHMNNKRKFIPNDEYEKFATDFCKYDSINNTKIVNKIIFENDDRYNRIIDYKYNKTKKHTVIVIGNLNRISDITKLEEAIQKKDENYIICLFQYSFNKNTNDLIINYRDRIQNLIIIPNNMPVSLFEKVIINIFSKYQFFNKKTKKIYKRELDRILPNIKISNIINYTESRKMDNIERLFNS